MKVLIIFFFHALVGSIVYTLSISNEIIHPLISFGFLISYSILGGFLFAQLDERGKLI